MRVFTCVEPSPKSKSLLDVLSCSPVGSFWRVRKCAGHASLTSCPHCPLAGRRGRTTSAEPTTSTTRTAPHSGTDPPYSKSTLQQHVREMNALRYHQNPFTPEVLTRTLLVPFFLSNIIHSYYIDHIKVPGSPKGSCFCPLSDLKIPSRPHHHPPHSDWSEGVYYYFFNNSSVL